MKYSELPMSWRAQHSETCTNLLIKWEGKAEDLTESYKIMTRKVDM